MAVRHTFQWQSSLYRCRKCRGRSAAAPKEIKARPATCSQDDGKTQLKTAVKDSKKEEKQEEKKDK